LEHGVRIMTQIRKGVAFAVMDAVRTLDAEFVVEFSLDGNCMVEQLPLIVEKLREGYEVVVVSRYLPPAKSADDTFITGFGNWMFSKMMRFLGPFPITDGLTIYRGYRRSIIDYPEFEAFLDRKSTR